MKSGGSRNRLVFKPFAAMKFPFLAATASGTAAYGAEAAIRENTEL